MPIIRFNCEEHGEFSKVLSGREGSANCPVCGKRVKRAFSVPKSTAQVKESADRPPVMTDREIENRVAQDAEAAWSQIESDRKARKEAEESLPKTVREEVEAERDYRQKLEKVMKNEPQENLDRAGVKVWRREDEHVSRMEEKYSASPEKRETQ